MSSSEHNGSVQSFYERMPYPAPLTNLDAHLELLKDTERRRIRSLLLFPEGESENRQQILVAGCGTSQAARVALREPDSRVVAIDISDTSLNHLRALQHLGEAFGADAAAIESWCRHWVAEGLATYERLLTRRPAAPFALGAMPTIADICIAGQIVAANLYKLDLAAFPRVEALGKQCFALSAFADAHPFQQPAYKNREGNY